MMDSAPPNSSDGNDNPFSFLNFVAATDSPHVDHISKRKLNERFSPSPTPKTPLKSIHHMSMREMREMLETMQIRNTDLEEQAFQVEQLKLKVEQLTQQLTLTENELTKSRKKCKRLYMELSETRAKEEKETEDLDVMVKKVEEKLAKSEARAAKAEEQVERLKQEQLNSTDVSSIAWQLSKSADGAESLVKQMVSGIGELRHFADALNTISQNRN